MKSDCSNTLQELHIFLDGEITDAKRERIQAHLEDCPPCLDAFDFSTELKALIADRLRTEAPIDLRHRIRAAIASE